jgi:outer membrane cobalamin receptor
MRTAFLKKEFLFFAMAIIAGNTSYSQVDSSKRESFSLKELLNVKITTASKTAQDLEMAPATVIVITQEQISLRGYQSLLDVLYDLPGMKVDDKVRSHLHNNFVMRGTPGQEKFILLLDGMRISSPTNETMPIIENYPVHLAEQIEVVLGPASALYGADAVSGVINIITKKSPSKKNIKVEATSMAGSYGYTNNTLFVAKKLNDHASLVVSGQYCYNQGADYSKLYKQDTLFNTDAYTTGTFNTIFGPMTPKTPVNNKIEMPLKAYNLYASLQMDEFSFSIFKNYAQTPTFYEENPNNAVYNKDVFMGQGITMANASYKKSFRKIMATTSLLASDYVMNPRSNYRNVFSGMEPAYKYSFGSLIKGEQQVDWQASEKFNVTGGATYESYYSIPTSADLAAPVDPDEALHGTYIGTKSHYMPDGLEAKFYTLRYRNIGTYLQVQYSPTRKVHFTFGGRYDVNSRYENTFNPRVGIVYRPTDKTTIKALYGTAFLAPTTFDCYAYYGAFETSDSGRTFHANFMHLPNPGLQPITSKNAELSISHYFTNNFSVTVDGYYTVLSGLHEFADDNKSTRLYNNMFNGIPVGYVEVFVNQTRQVNYGGSIQLNYKNSIGALRLNSFLSVSHTNGFDDYSLKDPTLPKAELEFIAPFMLQAGTDVKAGKFSCSPRLIVMGRQHLSGVENTKTTVLQRQTIAGYALMNISLRYAIIKKLAVFTNITNALNQHYRSVGFNMDLNKKNTELFYGQHEDPIRIMGGLNFTF